MARDTEAKAALIALWSSQMQEFKAWLLPLVVSLFTVVESLRAFDVRNPVLSTVFCIVLGIVLGGGISCLARSFWYSALTSVAIVIGPVEVVTGDDPYRRVNDEVIKVMRKENKIRKPEKTDRGKGPVRWLGLRILVWLGDTGHVRWSVIVFLLAVLMLELVAVFLLRVTPIR